MNNKFKQLLLIFTLLLFTGCTSIWRIDGPYEGRVIDAETKHPLEGVVVLGVWSKIYPNVAGSTHEFYDSVEMLTDKNGEFRIAGKGLRVFSNLEEMDVVIYKSGYEMLGGGPWSGFKTRTGGKNIKWDCDRAIISLRHMSYEERKKRVLTGPNIEQKRQQLLINEINKERIEFGYNSL